MKIRIGVLSGALLWLFAAGLTGQGAGRRPLNLDDFSRLRSVADPQISRDGGWVAYTVSAPDLKEDKNHSSIWMTSWDGTQTIRLTTGKESETTPRWSPDGRFLAFLSGREDENSVRQLWLLPRAGGEAEKITDFKGDVS
ncbi:MAG TPA: S9 family peptidase, partial [Thermoanaerobaculia bacterium]|nr:S9 family peptidase [Thermoanaerobaculia bacterium]